MQSINYRLWIDRIYRSFVAYWSWFLKIGPVDRNLEFWQTRPSSPFCWHLKEKLLVSGLWDVLLEIGDGRLLVGRTGKGVFGRFWYPPTNQLTKSIRGGYTGFADAHRNKANKRALKLFSPSGGPDKQGLTYFSNLAFLCWLDWAGFTYLEWQRKKPLLVS